jgi:hypothetical protein
MKKILNNTKIENVITIIGSIIFIPTWIFTMIGLIKYFI